MKVHKHKNIYNNNNIKLFNNINAFNSKKLDNIFIMDDSQNKNILSNTIYNDCNLNRDNFIFNLNNEKSKNQLFNINNKRKNKIKFNNEVLNLNIEKMLNNKGINKIYLNNNFSFVVKNALFDKLKYFNNIQKYHNLTNEKLFKLIEIDNDNGFILNTQKKINNNNFNIFNEYLNNIPQIYKNKSIIKNGKIFLNYNKSKSPNKNINNIKQYTLNSNFMDFNYKTHIHKSWCNLFKKNNKFNSYKNKKIKSNNKYQLTPLKTITITSDENINNKTKENKKSKKYIKNLKSKIITENNSKTNIKKINRLRKSPVMNKNLFKLINNDECFDEYLSDGRSIDKYQFFKNQIEKNRKHLEKKLIELRRHQT